MTSKRDLMAQSSQGRIIKRATTNVSNLGESISFADLVDISENSTTVASVTVSQCSTAKCSTANYNGMTESRRVDITSDTLSLPCPT